MDHNDAILTRGALDESGNFVTALNFADSRATPGMFGSGYLELLAREITADLRAIESSIQPGQSAALVSKGINFGSLGRNPDGAWDTSRVPGLPPQAIASTGAGNPPSLILQPWHQVGNVVSLRQFTVNAFNHHHGMQAEERVGSGVDQDGDGFVNELTRADITAATLFQAAMGCSGTRDPGRLGFSVRDSEWRNTVRENRLRQLPHSKFAPEQLDVYRAQPVQSAG